MSSSGGFWPGDPPAFEENEPDSQAWPPPRLDVEATDVAPPALESTPFEPVPPPPIVEEFGAEEPVIEIETEPEPEVEPEPEPEPEPEAPPAAVHVPGELDIPDGVSVLEGSPSGAERAVGIVVSRFNGEITNALLASALGALEAAGVAEERITVMPVPGAFELPIGAMALAKTRRYSCVIALGCVVRGETAHFDFVATEAASGLQLAGLETGVPVAFGVLTVDTVGQAEARTGRGADAARAALEMADLFSQVRQQARAAK